MTGIDTAPASFSVAAMLRPLRIPSRSMSV
jgi:hypothetical protein